MKLWILLLAIQGNYASLFEFPRFSANQPQINSSPHITASARLPEVSGVLPKLFGTKEETIQPPNSKFVPKDIKDTSSSGNDNVDEGLDSINISPGFHAAFNLPHISSSPHVTGVKPPNLSGLLPRFSSTNKGSSSDNDEGEKKDLKNSNISPGFHAPLNLPHINLSPPETGAKSPELSGVLPQLPNIQERSSSDDDEYEKDLGDQSISPGFHAALNLPHIRFSPHATGAKLPKLLPQFSSTNGRSSSDNDNTEGKGLKNLNISPGFHAGFNLPDINLSPSVAGAKLPNLPGVLPHLPTTREENSSNKGDDEEEDLNNLGISPGFHASFNLPNINLSPQSTGAKSLKLSEVLPSSPSSGEETIKHPNSKFDNVPNQGQKGSSSDDEVGDEKVLESLGISPEFYLKMTRNQIASLFGLNGKKHENSPIPAIDTSTTVRKSPVKLPKKKDNKKSSDKEARNSNIKKTSNKGDEGSSNQKSKVPNLDVQSIFGNSNIPQTSNNENEGSSDEELRLPNSFGNSNIHLPRNIDNEGFSKKIKKIPSLGTSTTIGNSRANFPRNHKKRISKRKLRTADSNVLTTTENSKINLLRKHDNEVFSNRNKKSPVQSQPKEEESSRNHLHGKKHKKRFSGQERRVPELGEPTATENFKPNLPTRNDNETSLFVKLAKKRLAETLGVNETDLQHLNLSTNFDEVFHHVHKPTSKVPATTEIPKTNVPLTADNESLLIKLAKKHLAEALGVNETDLQHLNLSSNFDVFHHVHKPPSRAPTTTENPKINIASKTNNETGLFVKLAEKRLAETLGVNETDLHHLNLSRNFDEVFHHVHKPTSKVPATTEIPKTNIPLTANNESFFVKLAKKHLAEALGVNETDLQHLNLSSNFDEVFHHVHKPPSRAPATTKIPKINIPSKANNESYFLKRSKELLAKYLGVNEADLQYLNLSSEFPGVFNSPLKNPALSKPGLTEPSKINFPAKNDNTRKENINIDLSNYNHTNHRDVEHEIAKVLSPVLSRSTRNPKEAKDLELKVTLPQNADPSFVRNFITALKSASLQLAPDYHLLSKSIAIQKKNPDELSVHLSNNLQRSSNERNKKSVIPINLKEPYSAISDEIEKIQPTLKKEFEPITIDFNITIPKQVDDDFINQQVDSFLALLEKKIPQDIGSINYIVISITLYPKIGNNTNNFSSSQPFKLLINNVTPQNLKERKPSLISETIPNRTFLNPLKKNLYRTTEAYIENNFSPTQSSTSGEEANSYSWINYFPPEVKLKKKFLLKEKSAASTKQFELNTPTPKLEEALSSSRESSVFHETPKTLHKSELNAANIVRTTNSFSGSPTTSTSKIQIKKKLPFSLTSYRKENLPKTRQNYLFSNTGTTSSKFLNWSELNTENIEQTTNSFFSSPSIWKSKIERKRKLPKSRKTSSFSKQEETPKFLKLSQLNRENTEQPTISLFNNPTTWSPKLKKQKKLSKSQTNSLLPKRISKFQNWSELNEESLEQTTNSFFYSPTTSSSKIEKKRKLRKSQENLLFPNTEETFTKFPNWSELTRPNIQQTTTSFFHNRFTGSSETRKQKKVPKSWKNSLPSKTLTKFPNWSELNTKNIEETTNSIFIGPTTSTSKIIRKGKLLKSQENTEETYTKSPNWSEFNRVNIEKSTNSFLKNPTTWSPKLEKQKKLPKFPNRSELNEANIEQSTNSIYTSPVTLSSKREKKENTPKSQQNPLLPKTSKRLPKFPKWSRRNTANEETTSSFFESSSTFTPKMEIKKKLQHLRRTKKNGKILSGLPKETEINEANKKQPSHKSLSFSETLHPNPSENEYNQPKQYIPTLNKNLPGPKPTNLISTESLKSEVTSTPSQAAAQNENIFNKEYENNLSITESYPSSTSFEYLYISSTTEENDSELNQNTSEESFVSSVTELSESSTNIQPEEINVSPSEESLNTNNKLKYTSNKLKSNLLPTKKLKAKIETSSLATRPSSSKQLSKTTPSTYPRILSISSIPYSSEDESEEYNIITPKYENNQPKEYIPTLKEKTLVPKSSNLIAASSSKITSTPFQPATENKYILNGGNEINFSVPENLFSSTQSSLEYQSISSTSEENASEWNQTMFEEPLDLLPSSTNTPSQEYSTSSIVENKSSTEWQETTTNPEIENGSTEAPFSKTNAAISTRSNQIRKEIIPNSSHRPTTKEEIFATSFIQTGAAVQQSSQEPSVEVTSISSPSISIEFSESQTFLPEAEIALDLSNYTLLSSESFFNESETSSESIESRIEPHISSESLYSTFSNWKNNNIAAESKRNSKSKLFTSPLNRFSELNARTNKETSKNPIIPKEQLSSTLPSTGYVHIKTEPNYLKNNFAFRNAHFSSQNKPYGVQEASQNTQIVEGESTTIAYSTEYSTILKGIQDNLIPEHVKARINPKNIPQLLTNSGTITSENSSSEEVIDLDLTQKDFESVKKLSEILRDLLADLAEKPNSNVELEVAIKPQPPTTKEHINTDWHEIEKFIRSNLYSIVRDVSNVIRSDLISHHGLQLNFTINTPMQLRKEFEENFSDSIKIILSKLFPKRGFLVTASKEDYSNVPAVSVNIFVSPSKLINAPLINLDKSKNLTSKIAQFLFKALNSKESQNEHDRIIDFAFATKNVVLLNFEELESLVIEVLKSKNIEGKAIAKYATLEIRKDGEIIIHMPFEIDSKLSKTDFKHQREGHSTKTQSEDRLKKVVLESLQRNDYEHPLERISDLLLLNK